MRLFEFQLDLDLQYGFNVVAFVRQNCSQALAIFKETNCVLYRGIRRDELYSKEKYFIDDSPVNRLPKDTPADMAKMIDKKLQQAGFTALRSNSIFCTSSYQNAGSYGKHYVIFPIDNLFSYTFCRYHDLTEQISITTSAINGMTSAQFIEYFEFEQDHLGYALVGQSEIYIRGKYLALRLEAYTDAMFGELLGFRLP